jgi:hypothetical protein
MSQLLYFETGRLDADHEPGVDRLATIPELIDDARRRRSLGERLEPQG